MTKALKWHGGKYYLAEWIVGQMPPHLHYVEPFFGGGQVLFARDPYRDWYQHSSTSEDLPLFEGGADKLPAHLKGCSEVVNDLNGDLMNFWGVLKDAASFAEFSRQIGLTPFSEASWKQARQNLDREREDGGGKEVEPGGCVRRAVDFFITYRQSRQALGTCFATLSRNRTRGCRNEQVNAWISSIDGLPDFHARLQNVVIMNQDALKLIRSQDGDKTLFYLDPPYVHATRVTTNDYAFEMTESQHLELLELLKELRGKFMLSGYHGELYDRFAERSGWRCAELTIDNKASANSQKKKMVECLWMNF